MATYVAEFSLLHEIIDFDETNEENDDTFVIVGTVVALMYDVVLVPSNLH